MLPSLPFHRKGFTLIELIIVIAIIAIIAAGVFVALDPVKRLNAGRNATRWTDVGTIMGAIKLFSTDSPTGSLAFSTPVLDSDPSTVQLIGTANSGCSAACATFLATEVEDVCIEMDSSMAVYLPKTPWDPSQSAANGVLNSRYYVQKDANNVITVGACDAQGEGPGGAAPIPVITVTQ